MAAHWVVKRAVQGTGGILPEGFPYIIDQVTGQVCEVALVFMTTHYLSNDGRRFPRATVDAYTYDLLDWMRFGADFCIPWDKATWADLRSYIATMKQPSPHHDEVYKAETIKRRLVPIENLYKWAAGNLPYLCAGAPPDSLFATKNVAWFLDIRRKELRGDAHVGEDLVADTELPNLMQPREVEAALKAIGPTPRGKVRAPNEETASTSVGHLGMELGLQAGLRVSEAVGLRVGLFSRFLATEIVESAHYRIGKFRRKGGRGKYVRMHGALLQKVVNYIQYERAYVMSGAEADHGILLVHKTGPYRGQPLCAGTLQRRFAKACMAAGLVRMVPKVRPVNGDLINTGVQHVQRARFTFHDLRHTFAVWTYYARRQSGDAEPWKYIQEQLGHEDVTTTIKTYLQVTQDFEAHITDIFIETLNRDAGITTGDEVYEAKEVF